VELMDAIRQRRSVREFDSEDVSDAVLHKLIEAACWAPSATNEQPWAFTIVKNKNLLNTISERAKDYMRCTAGPELPARLAQQLADPSFQLLHNAPVLVVISTWKPTRWAIEDCALAGENFMLAACNEGLGTCWIGMTQEWLGTPDGRKLLELPAGCIVVAPIIVGHPKSSPQAMPRSAPQITWLR
jgi:nitroreductase